MFGLFRKKRRRPDSRPPWLKWLLLVFILYAVYVVVTTREGQHTLERTQSRLEKNEVLDVTSYKNKIFPQDAAALRIQDISEGEGNPAVCGQQVALSYQAYLAQGNELNDQATREKPLRFTIGDAHVMPVFDRGVIGMKAGGKRSIIAPSLMAYGLEDYQRNDVPDGATIRMEMELLSISPPLPDIAEMPYRIAEVAIGGGSMLTCGYAADVRIKLWNLEGKLLYSNHEAAEGLTITPGKSEVMMGLEQGILGMLDGGTRLLIIPPAFQQTMHGNKPVFTFPMAENQTVMMEVEATMPAPTSIEPTLDKQ